MNKIFQGIIAACLIIVGTANIEIKAKELDILEYSQIIDKTTFMSTNNTLTEEKVIEEDIFSQESLEWLKNTKMANLSVGYPASVTPFNYYYYSSTLKGMLMDISNVFSTYTDMWFVPNMVRSLDNSEYHINQDLYDIMITGKQALDEDAHYTQSIAEFEYGIFVPKTSEIQVVDDLGQYSIGIVNNDDNIMKYLNQIEPDLKVEMYTDYLSLYEGIEASEIDAIFIPKDLFGYQNTLYNLVELPVSDYTISYWYFRGNNPQIVNMVDEVLDVFYNQQNYSEGISFHENALNNKFYEFDKVTHEWLSYKKPVLKVGIYDVTGFMMQDEETEKLGGLVYSILNEFETKFGINFEYVYDSYPELVKRYEAGELDILPNFSIDLDNMQLYEKRLEGKSYPVYRGDINAYGTSEAQWIIDENYDKVRWGLIQTFENNNYNINKYENTIMKPSINTLIGDLKSSKIDYFVADPTNLIYFDDQGLMPKGKIGKYTFELLVKDDEQYIKFFDAINEHDFTINRFHEQYKNIIATSTYLNEMVMLQDSLFLTQNRMFTFALIAVLGASVAAYFLFHYVQNKKTEHLKYTDSLTGLLNRVGYTLKENALIKLGTGYSFIILDIDKFKLVNDTYGHQVGDEAIIFLATILKRVLPPETIICRIGGDEFVICTQIIEKDKLIEYFERIKQELQLFKTSDNQAVELQISSGAIINKTGKMLFEEAYQKADKALYESKNHGRNCYTFYE